MFWMTRCVTNAMEPDVQENSLPSSVRMSHAYSTTVNTAGLKFTRDLVESIISLLSKKEQIVREQYLFDGARVIYFSPRKASVQLKFAFSLLLVIVFFENIL